MIDVAIIENCKNPNVDTVIIRQIIQVESNNNPLAINVNKIGSFTPKTKDEAVNLAKEYIAKGYSVDIGLMQFNSKNLNSTLFLNYSIDDLLDVCKNIKAGSDLFYLAYKSTNQNLSKTQRISKALSIYNTGNEKSGFNNGYVKKYAQFYDLKDYENAKKSNTKLVLEFNEYKLKDNKYIKQQGEIYD
ncbi:TPA: lytic transglycosylase domain-containing protein [Campylobacter fetus subsp. venerealis]|nr:lytic transglycosylase domain-containing protein [Campylobacter fetus subsp. venerealis]HDX6264125.1 lytic transglycosylase domain-containing protein [Campylobacter fetus subsp. venerealis]HDX6277997.1 lytic transglycosylase domain-containing protein [Campylobacter fetus subsp. venerealis]HDX6299729.1 lytic transglycosylase domain-containing protein [Campylobacter fetus subsp. venerealis]HDX8122138.1 lytic transglycosylase domain-containing protein [Campylobacter fetus subsp. venerealis]